MKRTKIWGWALAVGLGLMLTGCSTFNHDWKAASKTKAPADDITGAWDGSWLSSVNGHHGRLRSIVSNTAAKEYKARFKARFWKIFTYSYTVPLQGRKGADGSWQLAGAQNLGWLAGGEYSYTGKADPDHFNAAYSNKYDHGTFELKRPVQ